MIKKVLRLIKIGILPYFFLNKSFKEFNFANIIIIIKHFTKVNDMKIYLKIWKIY